MRPVTRLARCAVSACYEVKHNRLTPIDAKTGPRQVLLGETARELLRDLAGSVTGKWVFPGGNDVDSGERL